MSRDFLGLTEAVFKRDIRPTLQASFSTVFLGKLKILLECDRSGGQYTYLKRPGVAVIHFDLAQIERYTSIVPTPPITAPGNFRVAKEIKTITEGLAYHEMGHLLYSDMTGDPIHSVDSKYIPFTGFIKDVMNIMEDPKMEKLMSKDIIYKFTKPYFSFLTKRVFYPQAHHYKDGGKIGDLLKYLLLWLRCGPKLLTAHNAMFDSLVPKGIYDKIRTCHRENDGTERAKKQIAFAIWLIDELGLKPSDVSARTTPERPIIILVDKTSSGNKQQPLKPQPLPKELPPVSVVEVGDEDEDEDGEGETPDADIIDLRKNKSKKKTEDDKAGDKGQSQSSEEEDDSEEEAEDEAKGGDVDNEVEEDNKKHRRSSDNKNKSEESDEDEGEDDQPSGDEGDSEEDSEEDEDGSSRSSGGEDEPEEGDEDGAKDEVGDEDVDGGGEGEESESADKADSQSSGSDDQSKPSQAGTEKGSSEIPKADDPDFDWSIDNQDPIDIMEEDGLLSSPDEDLETALEVDSAAGKSFSCDAKTDYVVANEDLAENVFSSCATALGSLPAALAESINTLKAETANYDRHFLSDGEEIDVDDYRDVLASGEKTLDIYRSEVPGREITDLAISVLVDCSYSMTGKSSCFAHLTAMMTALACEESDVPYELEAFSTGGVLYVKHFDEKLDECRQLMGMFWDRAQGCYATESSSTVSLWNGTELEEALPIVLSGLRRYEEKQAKLLFVITDGDTGSPDRTGRLIQEAREEGIVVIGIGVGVSETNLRSCFGRCKSFSQESLEKLPDYIAQEIEEAMASVNFSGY